VINFNGKPVTPAVGRRMPFAQNSPLRRMFIRRQCFYNLCESVVEK
jgi:hypothetical protein